MNSIDTKFLFAFFRRASQTLEEQRGTLCALDGEIGDGDHGTSMANGFAAIHRKLTAQGPSELTPAATMRAAATAFIAEVGATVGPLYATGFLEAAKLLENDPLALDDLGKLLGCIADGIAYRGKARLGDKTMLDVWRPAAQAADKAKADGMTADAIAKTAADTAEQAAQGTKSMIANCGRAARLKERTLGHLDPGGVSAARIIGAMAAVVQDRH